MVPFNSQVRMSEVKDVTTDQVYFIYFTFWRLIYKIHAKEADIYDFVDTSYARQVNTSKSRSVLDN